MTGGMNVRDMLVLPFCCAIELAAVSAIAGEAASDLPVTIKLDPSRTLRWWSGWVKSWSDVRGRT